ncbi:BTAD domain-containing putative transcriptional regulator [Actinoplanes sp. NPDC049548]|uniref:AfsR/SARP family transcriptional regulator n=1 Tax=Actinoplanes sp. NPDC049548 TaxID=3155152 RepID=UPI003436BFE1
MRAFLLGTLELIQHGQPIVLGSPKQRSALAVLLTRANSAVAVDQIALELWGERTPKSASANVRQYLANLRRLVAADSTIRIERHGSAYRLGIAADDLDVARFRRLVAKGREAMEAFQHADAVDHLERALALWRGGPLSDLSHGPLLSAWCAALAEERISALEGLVECLLAVGATDRAVSQATELSAGYPLRERIQALLIRARYQAGDVAGALDTYVQVRRTMVDELGVEPGSELQELQVAILGRQSNLSSGRDVIGAPETAAILPRQLPPRLRAFVGRAEYIDMLDRILVRHGDTVVATVPAVAVVGAPGIGKTALTTHWAHRASESFPDGQLYADLRAFGRGSAPDAVLYSFLRALGVDSERIPADLAGRASLYRSLLAGRRVLVLLDSVADPAQVRPFLPGDAGSLVVVTSRVQLTGLVAADGAESLTLGLPSADEAREMLVRRLGAARASAEPGAVEEIVRACRRLPLALAIVASRAAARPEFPLADLADELRKSDVTLDAFASQDPATDPRTVFAESYHALSEGAARLFRLVGLQSSRVISVHTAAQLLQCKPERARMVLRELVESHLFNEPSLGHYTLHDLLLDYAAELVQEVEPEHVRAAAMDRLARHAMPQRIPLPHRAGPGS